MWLSLLGIFVALIVFIFGVGVSLTYSSEVGDMNADQGILIMRIAAGIAVVSAVWAIAKLMGLV
jgi:hypothetical protein